MKKPPGTIWRLTHPVLSGLVSKSSHHGYCRQNRPRFMQQRLKPFARAAWTRIVATEFFDQFLIPVDNPVAALHLLFRRETLPALAHRLKRRLPHRNRCTCVWYTSCSGLTHSGPIIHDGLPLVQSHQGNCLVNLDPPGCRRWVDDLNQPGSPGRAGRCC